ncbi:hypothetical protein GCM10010260_40170 [Streptomyces filipinensis]|uniref:Uncharacterized protein n=1 Tax=Streptomyces filipinensis TaxID=66887 RepID=A0A918ICP1_9ACTN|nr:hypothetical protein [Streptomyces filipinensis]GGU99793.1 hypothetical protein GCM10010260_40170 [Streptomyces filipinensis]
MAEQKSSSALTAPLRGAASVLRRVPGAGMVSRAAEETLDKVGAVSPRGRRIAVYAGAGVLGAAGVVEWPVAVTGAAVAWLTQPRPTHPAVSGAGQGPEPAHDLGTAALRSGHGAGKREAGGAGSGPGGTRAAVWDAATGASGGSGATAAEVSPGERTSGGGRTHGSSKPTGGARTTRGTGDPAGKPSAGPLGPTARPDRTTL